MPFSFQYMIVFSVGANEEPHNRILVHNADRTVVVRYPGRPVDSYFLEPEGAVMRIIQPKLVLLNG